MKVVIIEDEHLTAERINTLLRQIDPLIEVKAVIDSVKRECVFGILEREGTHAIDIDS